MRTSDINNILDVLLLLSGATHFANQMMFLYVTIQHQEKTKNLLNFFVSCTNPSLPKKSFTSAVIKYIAGLVWLVIFIGSLHSTEIIRKYFTRGIKPLSEEDFASFELIHIFKNITIFGHQPFFREPSSPRNLHYYVLQMVFTLLAISTYLQKYSGIFMFGLEIIVVLTMKFISSHVVSGLDPLSTSLSAPPSANLEVVTSNYIHLAEFYI